MDAPLARGLAGLVGGQSLGQIGKAGEAAVPDHHLMQVNSSIEMPEARRGAGIHARNPKRGGQLDFRDADASPLQPSQGRGGLLELDRAVAYVVADAKMPP